MDRHTPIVNRYELSGGQIEVYTPPSAPQDVPVSLLNDSSASVEFRFQGNSVWLPLEPGKYASANPAHKVFARSPSGGSIIVATGVEFGESSVATSEATVSGKAAMIAFNMQQKQILAELLLELRKANHYRAEWHGEEITERDL